MPKVSVIIPVYNTEKYLRRCLESVCNQTLKDIEIICIDDCSTDGSLSKLKEYAVKDTRIKVISFEKNRGVSTARNEGLKIAQGEYLGFVDPDDYIDLDFFEVLYNIAKINNSDIAKGAETLIHFDGKMIKSNLSEVIKQKNKYSFISEWFTAIYKKSMIQKNSISFPIQCSNGEDIVFLNRSVLYANHIITTNETNYYYERRSNSLDAKRLTHKKITSTITAYNLIADDLNFHELNISEPEIYTKLFSKNILFFLFLHYRSENTMSIQYCAESTINFYNKCLTKHLLKELFPYKFILNILVNNSLNTLIEVLYKFKTKEELIFYMLRQKLTINL